MFRRKGQDGDKDTPRRVDGSHSDTVFGSRRSPAVSLVSDSSATK